MAEEPLTRGADHLGHNSVGDAIVWRASLDELYAELCRALMKHPRPKTLFPALIEEIGEALREPNSFDGNKTNHEWLQVACVAMRLYVQGGGEAPIDVKMNTVLIRMFSVLEEFARNLQDEPTAPGVTELLNSYHMIHSYDSTPSFSTSREGQQE